MTNYDLAISYTWIYDKEFIDLTEKIFHRKGLKTFIIKKHNLDEVVWLLKSKKINFRAYLDRASDEDPDFCRISKILSRRKCFIINPQQKVQKAVNKYWMHKKLVKKKFELPKTILLPAYDRNEKLNLTDEDLLVVKFPFIIKPAIYSGGGEGVERNGFSLAQIQKARSKSGEEEFLIQEKIHPRILENKRAWFRVIWAFGKPLPVWWDDETHVYNLVTAKHMKKFHLRALFKIARRLARINGLDYFSTEIALTKSHRFVLIDYVNDQCDLRLKSKHADGVPDVVVEEFIKNMKRKIIQSKK